VRNPEAILDAAKAVGIHAIVAGVVGGDAFASKDLFTIPLPRLREANERWLPEYMSKRA